LPTLLEIPAPDPETARRLALAMAPGARVVELVDVQPATTGDVRALLDGLRGNRLKPEQPNRRCRD
jgi:DNA-directed RNA polymerase subunit F